MASLYIPSETFPEFETQIAETWDSKAGYNLVDVEYIDDAWTGVFVDRGEANAYEKN